MTPARYKPGMISIVIPTLNAAQRLALCLEALVTPTVHGLVKEVLVVDGGSSDDTAKIADGFGAKLLSAKPGRGGQLSIGARAAKGEWLLFLHGDTILESGWENEAKKFIDGSPAKVGVFTLAFDQPGLGPQLVATGAMMRTKLFNSPYGDQGLLIAKAHYDDIGGYKDMPLMEDVDIIRRIRRSNGAKTIHVFDTKAVTSAERYERDGYVRRVLSNAWTLAKFYAGVSPERLVKSYH